MQSILATETSSRAQSVSVVLRSFVTLLIYELRYTRIQCNLLLAHATFSRFCVSGSRPNITTKSLISTAPTPSSSPRLTNSV